MTTRSELLAQVRVALADGVVLVDGPCGIGKSTLVESVAADARTRGEQVLTARGHRAERWMAGQALADLLSGELADGEVRALARLARRGKRVRTARGTRFLALLRRWADTRPVLVVVDDLQWIDAASAEAIAHAARRADDRIRFLFAGAAETVLGERAVRVAVPPMTAPEVVELLEPHAVPERAATRIHSESAGNPAVAIAVCTGRVRELVGLAWSRLSVPARDTVLVCALAARPSVPLLHRFGRPNADADIAEAVRWGVLVVDGDTIRFTPPAASAEVAITAGAAAQRRVHRRLSAVVTSAAEVVRHQALARPQLDLAVARTLAATARATRHLPDLAAELYLLAADRYPSHAVAERTESLVTAVEAGVGAGVPELVERAAGAVLAESPTPAHRVRVRTALVRHAGQSAPLMTDLLAAAESDASGSAGALAAVHLWCSYSATLAGNARDADDHASNAVNHARSAGDKRTEVLALTLRARASRLLGHSGWGAHLQAALAVPVQDTAGVLHLTPAYLAARFEAYDDRLDDARMALLAMLGDAETGPVEDLMGPLCSLSDVAAKRGSCVEAMNYAHRAVDVAARAALSPGPGWYAMATAELAGGDLTRAKSYAEHGVRTCAQEGNVVFRLRHLHALGQALTRLGETRAAIAALREIQHVESTLGHADPTSLRWQPELVMCLVRTGEYAEAERVVRTARDHLGGPRERGAAAGLDRALAFAAAASGDTEQALMLTRRGATVFAALGQPVEQGRCLLVESTIERRRRHYTAAAKAAGAALDLFTGIKARPWATHARIAAAAIADVGTTTRDLTATEQRVADLVAQGASNREIALRLYVTTKAVEATLTRVYRKLGLRSRAQLVRHLSGQA
ncbi:DNA-binding CsgD family transcriptional regulator [Actinokineospora baliensis]|uniref:helix-turn-helix transcriptional regulator n=1 Tax=Actinokineospora baliensis TaxID=547056 RepID=UPI00195C11F0|nr:LuxR family transcriptional regulator [Actinokineospora baliensis]MBM7774028.1 DNA-binding CsgD family transcriptional regulator [Actinokineospora baliensis]